MPSFSLGRPAACRAGVILVSAVKGWTKISVSNANAKRLDKIIAAEEGLSSYNKAVGFLISEYFQKLPLKTI